MDTPTGILSPDRLVPHIARRILLDGAVQATENGSNMVFVNLPQLGVGRLVIVSEGPFQFKQRIQKSHKGRKEASRNFIISSRFVSRAGAALGSGGMEATVNGLIYIIGLIVVVMVVLSLLGLR